METTIKELIEHLAYLGNRVEHGIISGEDFTRDALATAKNLVEALSPKPTVTRTTGRK